jgi:hypothetical protein
METVPEPLTMVPLYAAGLELSAPTVNATAPLEDDVIVPDPVSDPNV